MTRISVIIPVYNAENHIARSVLSLLHQTIFDIEIIVVDDGSTDQTRNIIESFFYDQRIIYIYKENGGPASARNAGIEIAKGEYIGFIDSDDYADVEMYEKLYSLAIEYNADIVNCSYRTIYDDEKHDSNHNSSYEESTQRGVRVRNGKKMAQTANIDRTLWFVWKGIYRASIVKGLRFPDSISLGEETPFLLECLLRSDTVVETDERLYYYVQRYGSLTKQKHEVGYYRKLNDLYMIKREVYEKYKVEGYETDLHRYTMTHTIPMIIANEINSGKSLFQQREEFYEIRNCEMIKEAYKNCSILMIESRVRYLALLLKFRFYCILAFLCRKQ